MRKQILTPINVAILLLSLFAVSTVMAQDTLLISYQGMLKDATGEPITGSPAITFTIYTTGGVSKWTEEHSSVPVNDGLFGVTLGSQAALPDSVFNGDDRYLGIAVEGDEEIDPRTLLTSSPGAAVSRRVVGDIHTDVGELVVSNPSSYPGLVKLKVSDHDAGVDIFGNADPFVMAGNLQITTEPDDAGLLMSHGSHDDSLGVELRASAVANAIRIHPPDPCVPPEPCGPVIEMVASEDSASITSSAWNPLTNERARTYTSSRDIDLIGLWANASNHCWDDMSGHYAQSGNTACIDSAWSSTSCWNEVSDSAWSNTGSGIGWTRMELHNRQGGGNHNSAVVAVEDGLTRLTLLNGDPVEPPDIVVQATTDGGGRIGINNDSPDEALDVNGTTQTIGFKMPTGASDGHVLTSDADGNGTWQAAGFGGSDAGEFDGEVNSDMVETDPGGLTTINFDSPITSTEKPHFYITVVLKGPANGLVEGAAIKAVEDIKGAAGNWTGFDITVSKYSDGTSISNLNKVYVTWMAIGR